MLVQRADSYFSQDRPNYWRQQARLAETKLTEAKNNLAQKRASVRPGDRSPATEAVKRVQVAEKRVNECHQKQRKAKSWAIEISQECDELLGPLADVVQHCELLLPAAAVELRGLIDQLRLYAEQAKRES